MATKIVLRQLTDLFAPPVASKSPSPTFPHLSLPEETQRLLDDHLSHFAASFPLGGGGGHQRDVEGERERSRWRDGLGEIWASVEPLPGTEGEPQVIARVSAFLVLLDQLSSGVGEDDDSALVSRKDIGAVWWGAVLRRTMLGTPKDDRGVPAVVEKARGRKATPKWAKDSPPAAPTSMRPLTVSRAALASATRMMSWGMEPPATAIVSPRNAMTAFGTTVWEEYTERATAMVKGVDEGYGVRNLEECIIGWAEKWPEVRPFPLHFVVTLLTLLVPDLLRPTRTLHRLLLPISTTFPLAPSRLPHATPRKISARPRHETPPQDQQALSPLPISGIGHPRDQMPRHLPRHPPRHHRTRGSRRDLCRLWPYRCLGPARRRRACPGSRARSAFRS